MEEKQAPNDGQQKIQFHVAPDVDYLYRDIVNIAVGAGDVVFELGNHHRSMPGHVTISNRIVMSLATAYDLQNKLQQVLLQAQKQMHDNLQKQSRGQG
jgi:hypothetical protein